MNESTPRRAVWPPDLLRPYSMRSETKAFLTEVGLPEFIPGMTIEFGVYDSDIPNLVIGEDCDFPVYIDSASDAVFVDDSSPGGRCFVNSSVLTLDHFIQQIVFSEPSCAAGWSEQIRRELASIDPAALDETTHCLWPAIIERFQMNLM